jgi:hypothetical protein
MMLVIVNPCQIYSMGLREKSSRSVAMEPMIAEAIMQRLRIEVQRLSFLPEKMPRFGSTEIASVSLIPEMKICVVSAALVEKDGKKKVTIIGVP